MRREIHIPIRKISYIKMFLFLCFNKIITKISYQGI